MKIAIATIEDKAQGSVSSQAGRAPYFLIYSDKGELIETIKNPFAVGEGGAGFAVAKMLADKQVDLVIAEKFGPNMQSALQERGVKFQEKQGTVEKALKDFRQ